ncbi:MAG: hypothetical protein U1E78_09955 [Gammaproteobacteria bacterium]
MKAYYEILKTNIHSFVLSAHPEIQNLRKYIAYLSTDLSPKEYQGVILKFFPEISSQPENVESDKKHRNYFISFNELCKGSEAVNHELYQSIFSSQLSEVNLDSPSKRNIVSSYFKSKINSEFEISSLSDDPFVSALKKFISQQASHEERHFKNVSVKRRLFF